MAGWDLLRRCMAVMSVFACQVIPSSPAAVAQTVAQDGMSVQIAGRSLRCGQTPIVMDDEIPSEGLSVPGKPSTSTPFF